jgi:hypothetical protein
MMLTWPDQKEAEESLAILARLTEHQRRILAIAASDEVESRRRQTAPGLRWSRSDDRFIAMGLMEAFYSPDGDRQVRLTEQGRKVGRLAVATGPRPEYLKNVNLVRYDELERLLDDEAAARRQGSDGQASE